MIRRLLWVWEEVIRICDTDRMVIHLLFNSLGDWRARADIDDRKCSPVRLFSSRNVAPVSRSGAVAPCFEA